VSGAVPPIDRIIAIAFVALVILLVILTAVFDGSSMVEDAVALRWLSYVRGRRFRLCSDGFQPTSIIFVLGGPCPQTPTPPNPPGVGRRSDRCAGRPR
jgi:hypothetical protein